MRLFGTLALAALVSTVSLRAEAGSGAAWTAAKANLPKDTTVLVGLDIAQLTKSSLFSLGFPLILSSQPDVKDALDTIKSSCKLDPMKVVQSVVAGTDDLQKHGALYIAVDGLDQAKLVSCMESIAAAKGKKDLKVTATTDGKITELAMGDKKVYVSWIGKAVIAVPLDFTTKADLAAWSGQKTLAKSKVARGMAKVNTGAAVWAVSAVAKDLDDQTKMKMGYGSVAMSSGNLAGDFHVQLASAASAKAAAEKAQKELVELAANPGLAANLKTVVQAVKVTAAGDELAVKGAISESDLMTLAGALMQ